MVCPMRVVLAAVSILILAFSAMQLLAASSAAADEGGAKGVMEKAKGKRSWVSTETGAKERTKRTKRKRRESV